jgi:hypothetical protein
MMALLVTGNRISQRWTEYRFFALRAAAPVKDYCAVRM